MADIAQSLFIARVEGNEDNAFDEITDCINKYPDNKYPLLAYCDISVKYRNRANLLDGVEQLKSLSHRKDISKRTMNRYQAYLLALDGQGYDAVNLVKRDIARYPNDSRERIIEELKSIGDAEINS